MPGVAICMAALSLALNTFCTMLTRVAPAVSTPDVVSLSIWLPAMSMSRPPEI